MPHGSHHGSRTFIAASALVALALATALAACRAAPAQPLRRVSHVKTMGPLKALVGKQKDPADGRTWVIFYSPHPDDESIGMGQAIRRYAVAGYNVQVVLLTDGEGSHAYEGYYRLHPELWHDLDRDGVKGDRGDFGLERRLEFMRATTTLGVHPWRLAFFGAAAGGNDALSADSFPEAKVEAVMRKYETEHPGALHVTVAKHTDGRPAGPGDLMKQSEHSAACNALLSLVAHTGARSEFYKVYVYDLPYARRTSPDVEDDPATHDAKRRALLTGYDDADLAGHLAIGWHSVPVLIDDVLADTREFRVPYEALR